MGGYTQPVVQRRRRLVDSPGMLRVPISSARPGMLLGQPVFHPALPGHVLLRPGFVLDEMSLRHMVELRVPCVWVRFPALESVVRYASPEVLLEQAALASTVGRTLEAALRPAPGVGEGEFAEIDYSAWAAAVRALLHRLAESPGASVLVQELCGAGADASAGQAGAAAAWRARLAQSAANVCFLSLIMGLRLEGYLVQQRRKLPPVAARNVENLGLGALLHDIGMTRLERAAIERFELTGDTADPQWQSHTRLGHEMVRGRVPATAASVVLHHHQRFDGRGFPAVTTSAGVRAGQRGTGIHVFSRIVHVAELYDRLRNAGAARAGAGAAPVPVVRVLRALLAESRRRAIDPIVFKGLAQCVPAFAPGSIVALSNGQPAVVCDFDPLLPCRPVVRHLRSLDPQRLGDDRNLGDTYDLRRAPELRIVQAEGVDVSRDLFEPSEATEFDLRVLTPPRAATMGTTAPGTAPSAVPPPRRRSA